MIVRLPIKPVRIYCRTLSVILWSFLDSALPALQQHPGDFACASCADIIVSLCGY